MRTPGEIALIDLDGTLADYDTAMRDALERLRSPHEPPLGSDVHDAEPWLDARQNLIKQNPGFWRNLARIQRGFEVLDVLRELSFRLMVLSKGPTKATNAWTEKLQWVQEHLPDARVTIGEDKSMVYGRVLFDDWPPYVQSWLEWRPRGLVIMLDHLHNRGFEHPRVLRYHGDRPGERDELRERLKQSLPQDIVS
jgi:5'(3')-deoxyribonucleotidase